MKKVLLFSPLWGHAEHIGNHRVGRFVRWLAEEGFKVVIVRAGQSDESKNLPWGTEIIVRDPLRLIGNIQGIQPSKPQRKPNKLRRSLAYWFFNPDPGVAWAQAAARDSRVLRAAEGASCILSSSPPESAHVGAWALSQRRGIPHLVDLRDGWMDEPLSLLLRSSALRRWREGRLEWRILRNASIIQVTSVIWKNLLCARLPSLEKRVRVFTNGYPKEKSDWVPEKLAPHEADPVLIHAGRFLGSDPKRSPEFLLGPLLTGLKSTDFPGTIKLIGSLTPEDLRIIHSFQSSFLELGWQIECPGAIPHDQLLVTLSQADGLLVLSETHAAIPSKLFEYVPTGRPILIVTRTGSAAWEFGNSIPQAISVERDGTETEPGMAKFMKMVTTCDFKWACPEKYTERTMKKQFIETINNLDSIASKEK